ncbi:hypothetical protein SAMN05444411_101573 [Lutibacter oricola]|uniref:DUF5723 domain-containing protein n=1 Tax=Lutibacter oricola TaxID=762486 RepID=A0A1H2SX54_9FLAO|nr:DUF6029 family protein [Lutibacter oricola]SDW36253.1 hypothetical protein SAMN05444411_101573 [Lutibacter oricola]
MKKYLLLVAVVVSIQVSAQEKWFSGSFNSNSQYYVDDSKTGDFTEDDRFRSNNYLKLDALYKNFSFGVQIEGYVPQAILNFSPTFNKEIGLATYFANYKNEKLDITVGHFYEQFGSGLVLRSWEDRELGINNALMGGKVNYTPINAIQLTALYGKQRKGFELSNGEVFGLDSEINITDLLKSTNSTLNIGLSAVRRVNEEATNTNPNFNKNTDAFSGRLNFSKGNIYSNIEYVFKTEDALVELGTVNTNKLAEGNAFIFNTGYSKKGFGIDATFRRLENMNFYSDREEDGNIYNQQVVNYLPSLTKQHDYSLANIYVYQAQPKLSYNPLGKAGEIGTQIDIYYNLKKGSALGGKYGTKLALNYATWYGLDAKYNIVDRTYSSEFLTFGNKYFTDLNLEVRKKWSKQWASLFTIGNIYYNKKYIEETVGDVRATTVMAESTYKYAPKKSIRVEAQHLWTKDDKKNWLAGTLEVNLSPRVSFFATDMYNYGNETKKIHYYNFGGSFTKNSTRIALNYGRQRGGLVCVGGVCRFVPESTGFGLALSTTF